MKNLIRLIVMIAAIGAGPKRLTLPEFCALYPRFRNLNDFAIWAKDCKRLTTPIRGCPWMPFPGGIYLDKNSNGNGEVSAKFKVVNGLCFLESQGLKLNLTMDYSPKAGKWVSGWYRAADPKAVPLKWPDAIIEPVDPNTLTVIIDGLLERDPNDVALQALRDRINQ